MTGVPQPTKTRVRKCFIVGNRPDPVTGSSTVNLREFTTSICVYETIHKPYLTGKIRITDSMNLLENLGLAGGEPVTFAFDGGDGLVYENTLYVLSMAGNKRSDSLFSAEYDLQLIGPEYFNDKKNVVQQSFKHIPGTTVISNIHGQYIGGALKVLAQSMGPISKESYIVSGTKPFKAINDVRSRLNFAGYPSGNCLYFKNIKGHVLGPFEALFKNLSANETFTQKNIWGSNFLQDSIDAQRAIIAAVAKVEDSPGGRGSVGDIAAAASSKKNVFDLQSKSNTVKTNTSSPKLGSIIGNAGALLSKIIGGGNGGLPNMFLMDAAH